MPIIIPSYEVRKSFRSHNIHHLRIFSQPYILNSLTLKNDGTHEGWKLPVLRQFGYQDMAAGSMTGGEDAQVGQEPALSMQEVVESQVCEGDNAVWVPSMHRGIPGKAGHRSPLEPIRFGYWIHRIS